ncbi:hypothetical protein ACSQ67_024973 [Phaseolus vulgaris]
MHLDPVHLNWLRGRVGRADKEAHAYLFYPDKGLLSDQALERLAAIEECRELGQGFQLAEKDMGIRGFGAIFGEQQSGDVGNVGVDLFFEMLFESLSKVEDHCVVSVPYHSVQVDMNINPHLPSDYINYLENPMKILSDAERVAEKDIWSLMQFTENLRRQYGKEPRSMEILLKKLYMRRMAADLGISRIYSLGKMIFMKTNMSKKVFKLMTESMASDLHRKSLVLEGDQIKGRALLKLSLRISSHLLSQSYRNRIMLDTTLGTPNTSLETSADVFEALPNKGNFVPKLSTGHLNKLGLSADTSEHVLPFKVYNHSHINEDRGICYKEAVSNLVIWAPLILALIKQHSFQKPSMVIT